MPTTTNNGDGDNKWMTGGTMEIMEWVEMALIADLGIGCNTGFWWVLSVCLVALVNVIPAHFFYGNRSRNEWAMLISSLRLIHTKLTSQLSNMSQITCRLAGPDSNYSQEMLAYSIYEHGIWLLVEVMWLITCSHVSKLEERVKAHYSNRVQTTTDVIWAPGITRVTCGFFFATRTHTRQNPYPSVWVWVLMAMGTGYEGFGRLMHVWVTSHDPWQRLHFLSTTTPTTNRLPPRMVTTTPNMPHHINTNH